ncbi:mannose-P-dolichol utilization defect 1 protein homolog 2-like isoform X3 [Lycium ferocissimum]|uniref:mannose-P-dolichol utilization defect 1 protein homolog 2-like isoform X3 n=1 Tax=Lycium ferocissimum TaxID=112874 RepID=UPI002815E5B3|nr:mannose-P-dolichol utilization defect 1 protein homolog 2-like isoform X3 [Lycium ferocissimum]
MVELKFLGMNFGCVVAALSKGEFPEKDCLLPLISKLLGYAIVAASTTVKLPQILKILRHKSVRGLSVVSFELEVIGYTIALAYCLHKGLPFSAFGEYAFLLIQAVILVAIIYYFSQPLGTKTWIRGLLCPNSSTFGFVKGLSAFDFSFCKDSTDLEEFSVRVFTSLQEKAPMSVVMGSVIGVVMNGTILSQILLSQAPAPKKGKKTN